jgi:hypothetical protein
MALMCSVVSVAFLALDRAITTPDRSHKHESKPDLIWAKDPF